jgi:hypothetical protein
MTGGMEADIPKPKLLASTGARFSCSIAEFRREEKGMEGGDSDEKTAIPSSDEPEGDITNYFKSMQWYKLHPLTSPVATLIKLFLISSTNNLPGHLTVPVSSRIAPITPFALSSPRQISSPRTLPLLPSRHTHLCPPRNRFTH